MANPEKLVLNEHQKTQILAALKVGAGVNTAAKLCGLNKATLQRYLGREENAAFADACKEAQGSVILKYLGRLESLLDDEESDSRSKVQGITWALERLDKKTFGYKGEDDDQEEPGERKRVTVILKDGDSETTVTRG